MDSSIGLIRYAGTHLKNERQAPALIGIFSEAARHGWRTCVVFSRPPEVDEWLDPFREAGVQIEYLPRPSGNFDLGCARRANRLCRRFGCSVFHCDNMHTSPMIGAWMAGVPVRIWSKRSMQPAFEEGRRPTWRDRFVPSVRTTCALATQVLPVSRSVRQELISLGVPAEKALVFRNAADRPDLRVYDRNDARRRLGVGGDEPTVVAVGHAVPVKGWDVLIAAMAAVARAVPAARLVLIGSYTQQHEAPEYRRLAALIEKHGLANRVRFAGYVPDVYSALVGADVFVLPSRSEGDSNALLQALNCGLPCVATRVGSAADLIQDGVDGLLVDRDDVEGLAAALRRTLEDAALRAGLALRAASRKHAPTTREYAEKLVALYAELLRGKGIESTISKPHAPTLNSRGAA